MKKVNVKVSRSGNSDDVSVSVKVMPEDVKSRIPRPGDSIYIIEPYPVVDPSDVDDVEIFEEDIKLKPVMGYSYTPIMVMASVLNTDMDEVLVNGDYKIPLYKNSGSDKKMLTFGNEEEALETFKTLTTASIKEATRREELNRKIKENLKECLNELFH